MLVVHTCFSNTSYFVQTITLKPELSSCHQNVSNRQKRKYMTYRRN